MGFHAPLPYHLVNILLHAGAALLVWRILQKLKIPGAWLAAGIFALHPVEVESVAWISELKNTLSGVLFLGAALVYLRFDQARSRSAYFGALGLFGLGLLCKTAIGPLPVVLLAIFLVAAWKNLLAARCHSALVLFAVAIPLGLFTAWVEQKFVGAKGESFDFGFVERCLIAGRAFWFYLGKLFWPVDLIFIYPRWQISSSVWWQYLFPAAALLLFAILFALRKRWRGPLAGMLIFAVMLFPALGFFNVYPFIYSFVADHFQYLASVAVIALVAAGATLSAKKLPPGLRLPLSLALLACLAALTWHQSRNYTDRETLYRSVLQKIPAPGWRTIIWPLSLKERGRRRRPLRTMKERRRFTHDTFKLGIIWRGYWPLRLTPLCGMESGRSSWPGKLIDSRAATSSCCAHWQQPMPRPRNLEKRLKMPGPRCNWRGGRATPT